MSLFVLRKNAELYSFAEPLLIDLLDSLYHLKQARSSGNAVLLQRGGYGEADGLFGAREICDDEICGQRIVFPVGALDTGVEALEVYRYIDFIHPDPPSSDFRRTIYRNGLQTCPGISRKTGI